MKKLLLLTLLISTSLIGTSQALTFVNNNSSNNKSTKNSSNNVIEKNFEVDSNSSHALQFKDLYVDRRAISKNGYPSAISYLDLDGDGDTDIFISAISGEKKSNASEVYINDGSNLFTLEKDFISNTPGQVHPRKSIIGDYNGDGKEDIYLAGHGWDYPPYPGEAPILILSNSKGYTSSVLDEFSGFQHGAASADIDADGDLDIAVSDIKSNRGVSMLLNDGSGNFSLGRTKLRGFNGRGGYYTVELVDVDQDGYVDLLLAGHEHEGANSTIFWGSELGYYSSWNNKTDLSKMPGYGIVIDIDVGDIDNDGDKDIILNRTGSDKGKFYNGYHVQILKNNGNRDFSDFGSFFSNANAHWIHWIRLVDINHDGNLDIIVDDAKRNLIWINSGSGKFSREEKAINISISHAYKKTGLEGWSDASICKWLKQASKPKPLAEAKRRGIRCKDGVPTKLH
jgi:hypothetical protein